MIIGFVEDRRRFRLIYCTVHSGRSASEERKEFERIYIDKYNV